MRTADVSAQFGRDNEAAAERLYELYAGRLARVAEKYLNAKLAGRLDPEDVVQSALRTFFRRSSNGELVIDSSKKLWKLLVLITVRKAQAKARGHTAQKRNARAEGPGGDVSLGDALSREPGPVEAAIVNDLLEQLMRDLPAVHQSILQDRMKGCSADEIAEGLRISRRSVYRFLDEIEVKLQKLLENP